MAAGSSGGLIRRLMVSPPEGVDAPAAAPAGALDAPDATGGIGDVPGYAALLRSMGPIFRAALMYPGMDAEPAAWALAVGRMSDVSTALAQQLAQLRRDEMDVDWARRELHPALATLVAEFWVQALIRNGGARSVADIPLRSEDILPGLVAAERAIHANGGTRPAVPLTIEAELLPALGLVSVHAQRYVEMLTAQTDVAVSADGYLHGLAEGVLGVVERSVLRAVQQGVAADPFREALLRASVGIIVMAADGALHEMLQRLADASRQGQDVTALLSADGLVQGLPLGDTLRRVEVGIGRLAGTCLYITGRLEGAHGQ